MKNIDIFPWNDHFNTGIETVDIQHRKLVTLLNRLATLVAYQSNNDQLNTIFDELTEYTIYHFQTEEGIWNQYLEEDSLESEHQTVHQKFIDTILRLKEEQETKPLSELAEEALEFLARWLASHILESDRYMAYVVHSLKTGSDLETAKTYAHEQMSGSGRVLIDIILSIYATLSTNTVRLMRELQSHTLFEQKFSYEEHYRELLLELSTSFINLPLDQIDIAIESALEKMATFVSADRAYIFDYDFDTYTASNTHEWCAEGITPQIEELQNVPLALTEDWPQRHARGEYTLIPDVFAMPKGQLRDILLPQEIQSLITFPIFENNSCAGFVGFDAVKQKHIFSDTEITLLRLFSSLLGNIAERNHTETTLLHERGFLKTLIQSIPDLVWMKDPDGVYLGCNERFEAFFGAKEVEIVGKTDYDFIEKSLADFFRIHDKTVMQNDIPNVNEEEIPFASDGHREILQTTKVPVHDQDGNLLGVLGVSRNITELKETQKELELKERYQRALLDNFPFLVWLKDEQSRFLAVNKPFADACNVSSPDQLTGKTDLDLWPQELAQGYQEDDTEVLVSGKPKNVEELVPSGDQLVWMETYKSPVTLDGNTIGTVGFARDVTEKKELQSKLINERNRFEKYLQTVEAIIVSIDAKGNIILVNRKGCDLLEYTHEELIGKQWFEYCLPQPEGMEQVYPVFLQIMAGYMQGSEYFENVIQTKSGKKRLIAWHNTYLTDENDVIIGTLSAGEDITEKKKAEENLRLAASVFTHTHEAILITSAENIIIDLNQSVERITGYSREELIGKNPKILSSGRQSAAFYDEMWKSLQTKGFWHDEIWNRRKNGDVYAEFVTITAVKNDNNEVLNYVALFSDITPMKEHQERLEYIAHYDALTGLPNRLMNTDRLRQAMLQSRRRNEQIAILYLDLDGFKEINDIHGHHIGDKLLIALSSHMKNALRDGDTIARLGGDEFVVILIDLDEASSAFPIIQRLLDAASDTIELDEIVVQVSVSIGVTFYPQNDTVDADQLIRQADQAMYEAKQSGKNRFHIFNPEHDRTIRIRHENIDRVRLALENREFVLYYQPKINMRTNEIIGVEALIRWKHPQKGIIPPLEFIPIIENHPLAVDVGEWVINEAISQINQWKSKGLTLSVSVNIGARQLLQANFAERLRTITADHENFDSSLLEIEILETSALENVDKASAVIQECRTMGINSALDDFGTGYSSLTYLKQLPIKTLKIDQSFVRDMLDDADDLAILEGIVGLAKAFSREVIAEGVETYQHGQHLLSLGCEYAQGYGIARPMPPEQMVEWAEQWKRNHTWQS